MSDGEKRGGEGLERRALADAEEEEERLGGDEELGDEERERLQRRQLRPPRRGVEDAHERVVQLHVEHHEADQVGEAHPTRLVLRPRRAAVGAVGEEGEEQVEQQRADRRRRVGWRSAWYHSVTSSDAPSEWRNWIAVCGRIVRMKTATSSISSHAHVTWSYGTSAADVHEPLRSAPAASKLSAHRAIPASSSALSPEPSSFSHCSSRLHRGPQNFQSEQTHRGPSIGIGSPASAAAAAPPRRRCSSRRRSRPRPPHPREGSGCGTRRRRRPLRPTARAPQRAAAPAPRGRPRPRQGAAGARRRGGGGRRI